MLHKEMSIAYSLSYNSEGIVDNHGNYLPGYDFHRRLTQMEYDTLKIVYDFVQNMETI